MIEILSSSALATVQDLGRAGGLRWGVGTSGAMDALALAAGNLLLGNEESAAAIEIPVFPFRVRFVEDCAFAVTGADCAATLDARPLMPWSTYAARAGQVLSLGMPRGTAWRAARASGCREAPHGVRRAPTCAWPAAWTCLACSIRAARSCAAHSAASKDVRCARATRCGRVPPDAPRARPASDSCLRP
jgi:hypothetical protein